VEPHPLSRLGHQKADSGNPLSGVTTLCLRQRSLRGIVAHDGVDGFMGGGKALGVAASMIPMVGDERAP
jgi:hypothetical protein